MRARKQATVLGLDLATRARELDLALGLEQELAIRAGGRRMGAAGLGAHRRRRRL